MPSVIDSNVLIAANGRDTHASEACQLACIDTLMELKKNSQKDSIAIDNHGLILEEYSNYMRHHGQPGVGDMFYKFIHDNMYSEAGVRVININPCDDQKRGFLELPENDLDRSDRKFLAVAVSARAAIFNATDSDWQINIDLTRNLGVVVRQLCPEHSSKSK